MSSKNEIENTEIDQYIYDQLVFYNHTNVMQFNGEMKIFLTNGTTG